MTMVTPETCRGPLAGIRAIDLCDTKGAFCTKLLADLGAEVIRVTSIRGPDQAPLLSDPDTIDAYLNANKIPIRIHYDLPQGRDLLADLIATSDVLVESFAPGTMDTIGLDFDSLHQRHPGLIMASITWFGQSGPRKNDLACDLTVAAAGGQAYVSGAPGRPPLAPFGEQSHYVGSLFGAVGIALALQGRRKDGKGRHLDISLQEAGTATLDHVWMRYFRDSVVARRSGGRHWDNLFHILPCRDGFIHLTPFNQWHTLVDWLDGEGMAQDLKEDKWESEDYRTAHADHVIDVLQKWTRTYAAEELFHLAQLMGFPWAPVCMPEQVLASQQLDARKFFQRLVTPDLPEPYAYPGVPYQFFPAFDPLQNQKPFSGDNNQTVYERVFGLDPKTVAGLAARGVIPC